MPESNPAPVVIVGAVILAFEWLGGMSCVAYTDAVQAIVLIIIMLIFPIVFSHTFGGWVNVSCIEISLLLLFCCLVRYDMYSPDFITF